MYFFQEFSGRRCFIYKHRWYESLQILNHHTCRRKKGDREDVHWGSLFPLMVNGCGHHGQRKLPDVFLKTIIQHNLKTPKRGQIKEIWPLFFALYSTSTSLSILFRDIYICKNHSRNFMFFKFLAKVNKLLLPSYTKRRLDLAKASKFQLAIIGWRYYVTSKALG